MVFISFSIVVVGSIYFSLNNCTRISLQKPTIFIKVFRKNRQLKRLDTPGLKFSFFPVISILAAIIIATLRIFVMQVKTIGTDVKSSVIKVLGTSPFCFCNVI